MVRLNHTRFHGRGWSARYRESYGRVTLVVPWRDPTPAATRVSPLMVVPPPPAQRISVSILVNVCGSDPPARTVHTPVEKVNMASVFPVIPTRVTFAPAPKVTGVPPL